MSANHWHPLGPILTVFAVFGFIMFFLIGFAVANDYWREQIVEHGCGAFKTKATRQEFTWKK